MSSVFSRFKKKENDPSGGADEYEKVQLRPKSLDTSQKKKSNLLAPTISSSSKATSLSVSKKTRPVGDWVSERKNGQSTYKVAQKNNNLYKPGLTKSTPNLAENRFRSAEKKTASLQRGKGLIVNTAIPRAGVRQKHDDLSRASSVSNLAPPGAQDPNQDHLNHVQPPPTKKKAGVLSKARKSLSKDRLDDEGGFHANAGIGSTSGVPRDSKRCSVRSIEIVEEDPQLRERVATMTAENAQLTLQLVDHRGQITNLQKEITRLKMYQEQNSLQMEQLSDENASLRNKLRDVVHSPLSDNEKQQLLLDSHRHHSSAPASIAPNLHGLNVEESTATDWDKQSTSNGSEVSVACLQDKINQMQETHYSTNEELQATLHELTDLQKQLGDLQTDNERLLDEKNLMFDSLCRQTERLNDTRDEVESLKQVLYREEGSHANHASYESALEREAKLVEMLKCAQEEREMLLLKQEQLTSETQDVRSNLLRKEEENRLLGERLHNIESALDGKNAEHRQLEQELAASKDTANSRLIECDRLNEYLENARTKINELEQERAMSDKSEAEELLDNARKEKDALEAEVANLKEQVARGKNEMEKLKEQVSVLQEECKVLRNNAKCTRSELEYKVELLTGENKDLGEELQRLEEAANELQVQAQCQIEDKRQLSSVLSETQRNMSEIELRKMELEAALNEMKKLRDVEMEEWDKFQNDLLTSVRVANDFKNEAQQELQKFVMENKAHRERIRALEAQLEKTSKGADQPAIRPTSFPIPNTTSEDLANRRPSKVLSRQSSRQSVKSLIETIENAGKPISKSSNGCSRSSSSSSLNSLTSYTSDGKTPSSPLLTSLKTPEWLDASGKTPMKEVPNKPPSNRDWTKAFTVNGKTDSTKKEESLRDSILQTTKSLDYSRRNSYSDASDRKDPLNSLVKNGGSKRNALLKWCQNKTVGYRNIDITNFSSSWNDGLGFCAILHTYLPERVPYDTLKAQEKRRNFSIAFQAAESVGIPTSLNINEMVQQERPDWQQIMGYVTAIYKHFEV